jgi:hypothetical protein
LGGGPALDVVALAIEVMPAVAAPAVAFESEIQRSSRNATLTALKRRSPPRRRVTSIGVLGEACLKDAARPTSSSSEATARRDGGEPPSPRSALESAKFMLVDRAGTTPYAAQKSSTWGANRSVDARATPISITFGC